MSELEIGRILRPHGLKGDVIVVLITNRTERLAAGSRLNGGTLEVVRSAAHQHRWIVSFAGVTDRDGAEALRGTILTAAPLDDDPGGLWVHRLIGAEVRTPDGRRHGTITSVEANPASDILVLDDGRLVPLRFVTEATDGCVTIDPPEGLLE